MSFFFQAQQYRGALQISLGGELNFMRIHGVIADFSCNHVIPPTQPVLCDLREVQYRPSFEELCSIVEALQLHQPHIQGPIALILREPTDMARVAIACSFLRGLNLRGFCSTDLAMRWLMAGARKNHWTRVPSLSPSSGLFVDPTPSPF